MQEIARKVVGLFEENSNESYGIQMDNYMKNNFNHYGIKANLRRALIKEFYPKIKLQTDSQFKNLFEELWNMPQREYHHAALDFAILKISQMDETWLTFWKEKILSHSWWDSVDVIAPWFIGSILRSNKSEQIKYGYESMEHTNMWMNRSAIIFQLKYKKNTNEELLYEMILASSGSKEFFIKKAGGWALREYGKTNPTSVSHFINQYRDVLSKLTVKEGERNLFLEKTNKK
ncbi:MAG: hypothetical protein RLZZ546_2612 [Bacteroidota bacterium]|jgi:3-methyladenine DNA glycosylase AlkD